MVVSTGIRSVIRHTSTLLVEQPASTPDGSPIAFVMHLYYESDGPATLTVKPDGTGLRD